MSPRLLAITNSDAGTADDDALDEALDVLRSGAEVEVAATSSPEELDDVLAKIDGRTVVVVGGDGSMHAVVAALHRANALGGQTLGLVPLGTGNDFARTLGIPLESGPAAQIVLDGTTRPVDLIIDGTGEITVNNVHAGAGAAAGVKGAKWKERLGSVGIGKVNLGKIGYPIGAFQTALNPPTLRVRAEVDGKVVVDLDEEVLMVAIGNGASVGGGLELTPDADPHDGQVDVLVATPVGTLARLGYALRLPFGSHEQHADVRIVRGREVRLTGASFSACSDGEFADPTREQTWRVVPAAYRMLLPSATDPESETTPDRQ